jgi:cytoskeletal protein CcmA (bactofilin family)
MAWGSPKKEKVAVSKPAPMATPATAGTAPAGHAPTQIGPTVVIDGGISSEQDMLISGVVVGEIKCREQIIVAAGGRVEGRIHCRSIIITGEVRGNIDASEQITIESSGRLSGDIHTKKLINQLGGFFEGYSHMIEDPLAAAPSKAAKEQPKKIAEKTNGGEEKQ